MAYQSKHTGKQIDDGIDAVGSKLGGTDDLTNNVVTFVEAEEKTDIASGETVGTLFGKILKWLKSLSEFATKDKYGDTAISLGRRTDVGSIGTNSVATGDRTQANGNYSVAIGSLAQANATAAVALGREVRANSLYSVALGEGAITKRQSSVAVGAWNVEDTSGELVHTVGNGTSSSARSNAHTVAQDGTGWFQGDVYVGSTSGTNKDEGSKKLATEEYVDQHSGGAANILIFENITVPTSVWVEDTTYEEFGYKADISCTGVTTDFFSDVVFGVSEATSGNYAPISATGEGIVTIYAVDLPSADITIPTIICSKGA